MNTFKVISKNNLIKQFPINLNPEDNSENNITNQYNIIQYVFNLKNIDINYHNEFKLFTKKVINLENLPAYWIGYIYSENKSILEKLYQFSNNNLKKLNDNLLEYYRLNFENDTIIGNKLSFINIESTYKTPEWIIENIISEIDKFLIKYIEYQMSELNN